MIDTAEVAAHVEDLLDGRREGCRARVWRLLEAGTPLRDLYTGLFTASLYQVGERWARGEITVADEHLATALTEDLLSQVFPRTQARPELGLTAVVSCSANEYHQVGGRIVADVLELQGWRVHFLGANLPPQALAGLVAARHPDLVALSVALEANLPGVREAVGAIREVDAAVPVVVGGLAFASAAARAGVERLPGVRHVASLEALEALAAGWRR